MTQRLYDITALESLIEQGFTLLTPNHRLTRRIKSEWDARRVAAGERAWRPLQVQTLETWLLGRWELAVSLGLLPPAAPLGEAQALELWRQVIDAQQAKSAHLPLLLPAAAAEIALEARETLQRWRVDPALPAIRQLFALDRDCETFWQWLRLFESRMKKSGLCMPADCLAQLPSVAGQLPRERAALVEFDTVAPLLRAALNAVCEQVHDVAPASADACRVAHPFSDKRAELQAVAAWVVTRHRADPTTTIGIVPGDASSDRVALEYLLRREFDCLGENYNSLPVNVSAGIPLSQAPLVRDALAVLALGLSHTTLAAVVGLIHSRFLDLDDTRGALSQRFVNCLYAKGREAIAVGDLIGIASQCAAAGDGDLSFGLRLRELSSRRELRRAALPSAWATQFGNVLAQWGWPCPRLLDSVEHQQWAQWNRTLEAFRAFDAVCGALRYGDALGLLRDCCSREISHPQTEDSPIHILGPLEAAGLAFDHLWLCGMQASSWPASPRPNPFIPLSLQSRLQMPHANPEREQAFSTALLQRYARTSRTLHASYARQLDGVADAPSALLGDFEVQVIPDEPAISSLWSARRADGKLEEVVDHRAPQLDPAARTVVTGGSRLLEDQSHCPFRAFARHRLHIPPQPDLKSPVPAHLRGTVLHAALFTLWGELGSLANLLALDAQAQELAVERAIAAALASVPADTRRNIGPGYWQLETQRLAILLREWLAVERERGEFAVVAREEAFTFEIAGLTLQLRVDRIDQLPDGSRVIIDYKSGHCRVHDWLGERPASPQLLLYAVAEPDTAAALAFARVRPRECGFIGLGRVEAAQGIRTDIPHAVDKLPPDGDWHTLNAYWRDNLEKLAQSFVAGEAQVDPLTASSCDHCGLQPLCRVAARAAATEGDAL